jgi:hypothetical protein
MHRTPGDAKSTRSLSRASVQINPVGRQASLVPDAQRHVVDGQLTNAIDGFDYHSNVLEEIMKATTRLETGNGSQEPSCGFWQCRFW